MSWGVYRNALPPAKPGWAPFQGPNSLDILKCLGARRPLAGAGGTLPSGSVPRPAIPHFLALFFPPDLPSP